MLLIAVMVVIPVADALSCSLEVGTAHADEVTTSEDAKPAGDDDDGAAERLHGICSHNHCHHATAHLTSSAAAVHDLFDRGPSLCLDDHAPSQDVPEGLMRPPRV